MNPFANRLTPRTLGLICGFMLVLLASLYLARAGGLIASLTPTRVVSVLSPLFAYGIAMLLCIEIAAEYRSSRDLRAAWIFLGMCAAISMSRHLFDTPLVDLVWPGYWRGPWSQLLRELLAATALTLLAAGILTMAEAFRRMLAQAPDQGKNNVLITHKPNIIDALGKDWFDVKEGEASIFKPEGGKYRRVARVQMEDWPKLAVTAN